MNPNLFDLKTKITLLVILITLSQGGAFCRNRQDPANQQQAQGAITPAQTATIKNILSKFNASKLTAADAKAIHEKFREAGIHAGPETRDAIVSAGFDPEKLKDLDPPKNQDNAGRSGPPSNEERLRIVQEKVIKPLSLTTAQNDVVTNAFKEFFTEMEKMRKSQANPQQNIEKAKIDPLEKARDEKIRKVLSVDLFMKYKELDKATRPPRPDGPGPNH